METKVKKDAIYRHYKGKYYKVYGTARHSESLEELVYYECLYDNNLGRMWVRPIDNFTSSVKIDGVEQPRFALTDLTEVPGAES